MSEIKPLEFGKVYHIYNRGVNKRPLFETSRNYEYFIKLYFERIGPVVDTYAWCLMRNHFHFMLRIKTKKEVIDYLSGLNQPDSLIGFNPSKMFSNFFVAYAKAFNCQEKRKGALFERPFCRLEVDTQRYFQHLVVYIHRNPVHHGFVKHPREYDYSSYNAYFSVNPSGLRKDSVFSWFDSTVNFKAMHRKELEVDDLSQYLPDEEDY